MSSGHDLPHSVFRWLFPVAVGEGWGWVLLLRWRRLNQPDLGCKESAKQLLFLLPRGSNFQSPFLQLVFLIPVLISIPIPFPSPHPSPCPRLSPRLCPVPSPPPPSSPAHPHLRPHPAPIHPIPISIHVPISSPMPIASQPLAHPSPYSIPVWSPCLPLFGFPRPELSQSQLSNVTIWKHIVPTEKGGLGRDCGWGLAAGAVPVAAAAAGLLALPFWCPLSVQLLPGHPRATEACSPP